MKIYHTSERRFNRTEAIPDLPMYQAYHLVPPALHLTHVHNLLEKPEEGRIEAGSSQKSDLLMHI